MADGRVAAIVGLLDPNEVVAGLLLAVDYAGVAVCVALDLSIYHSRIRIPSRPSSPAAAQTKTAMPKEPPTTTHGSVACL